LQKLDDLIVEHTKPPVTAMLRQHVHFAIEQAEAEAAHSQKQDKLCKEQSETITKLEKQNHALERTGGVFFGLVVFHAFGSSGFWRRSLSLSLGGRARVTQAHKMTMNANAEAQQLIRIKLKTILAVSVLFFLPFSDLLAAVMRFGPGPGLGIVYDAYALLGRSSGCPLDRDTNCFFTFTESNITSFTNGSPYIPVVFFPFEVSGSGNGSTLFCSGSASGQAQFHHVLNETEILIQGSATASSSQTAEPTWCWGRYSLAGVSITFIFDEPFVYSLEADITGSGLITAPRGCGYDYYAKGLVRMSLWQLGVAGKLIATYDRYGPVDTGCGPVPAGPVNGGQSGILPAGGYSLDAGSYANCRTLPGMSLAASSSFWGRFRIGSVAEIPPAPSVSIGPSSADIVISWPTNDTHFILESVANLDALSGWTRVTNARALINGQNVVTNQVSRGSRFYRLRYAL